MRRPARITGILIFIVLSFQAVIALEKRKGTVRLNQSIQCTNQCDTYYLEPDATYDVIYLKPDGMTQISLRQYQDMHVEVTGYQARCNLCTDLFVTEIRLLPTTTDVTLIDGHAPAATMLEQNYPNPFNPSTTIHYNLHERADVMLAVFNVLGTEMTRLVSAAQLPGRYSITWDAYGQPDGLYFCRLTTSIDGGARWSTVRKMLYVK
ncbi:MAG: T9SS type A sorting domain-containing protein [Ignavibacteriae bacterium]|nr:T9SS type A sorting domain-containing protein [Ignavibacteria bacterium]MBI3363900.1 T9SS type A sorting domain-containing protein [Ignavibacteriota bacterium]